MASILVIAGSATLAAAFLAGTGGSAGSVVVSGSAIATFIVWGFLLGIAAVWIYAAIRPRYGAGVGTAARAGLIAWGLSVFLANLTNYPLGLFPTRLLVITSVVSLFEIVIATTVGAWPYKEEDAPAVRRAAA